MSSQVEVVSNLKMYKQETGRSDTSPFPSYEIKIRKKNFKCIQKFKIIKNHIWNYKFIVTYYSRTLY